MGRFDTDPVRVSRIKIKRSVFTCSLAYVSDIHAAKAFISKIAKENKTATHNCWAYVVGDQGRISHSSDAGEPSGTAGKPMLNTITSHDMTQAAAVVTRQYGGVKLGVRGLIQAYSESVASAIALEKLVKLVKVRSFFITVPYDFNDVFVNRIERFNPAILDTQYAESITYTLEIEDESFEEFRRLLHEYQGQGRLSFTD